MDGSEQWPAGCHHRTGRKWQATQCPPPISLNSGSTSSQILSLYIQRVWKWQPLGGLIGLGTSPSRMIRFFLTVGSGMGTAESKASVEGCCGFLHMSSSEASSTI